MAFWGIEVKPGQPITHYCEKARGRLRVSQATLGIGEATMRSFVQCEVGERSPVLLCVLLPGKTEFCQLDLEFEEPDDVIFSVIGPQSVYLTGYYVQKIQGISPHGDSESFGVDIENTHTEGSSYCSDDNKYEDSFINDDCELRSSQELPLFDSKGVNEATLETDEWKDREGKHSGQHRKKNRMIESDDDDANPHESEYEDSHTSSASKDGRAMDTTACNAGQMITDGKVELEEGVKDDGVCDINKLDRTILRVSENPKVAKTLEEVNVPNEKVSSGDQIYESAQSGPMSMGNDGTQSIDLCVASEKPERNSKKRSKKEKTCTNQTDNRDSTVLAIDEVHDVEASTNMVISGNSEDGQKSKKRKREQQVEGINLKGTDSKFEQNLQHADTPTQEQPGLEEIHTEEIVKESQEIPEENNLTQVLSYIDNFTEDLQEERGGNHDQLIDNIISTVNKEILASYNQPDKKIKKKKKTRRNGDLNIGTPDMTDKTETSPMETDHQSSDAVSSLKQAPSNELIIEELVSGPPDAKVAAPGKIVKMFFTAMLKETGHVFDSNVGKKPFRFRLGDEYLIDGWNIGIDGMRVGGKRKLIIPPSMAFGDEGLGEDVPPNSWLIYEVELLSIRN